MINRRKFLRNFGIAGTAVAVNPLQAQQLGSLNNIKHERGELIIKGRVQSNGKPVANIAVSDGYDVKLTDDKGNYEIVSNNKAEFVFISVPSGFEIPTENGIAQFYKSVIAGNSSFKADFDLKKLEADDTRHHFVVWADTQMISKEDANQLKRESVPDLIKLVQSYPKGALFHGIGCGDLVWDKFDLYADYKEAIAMTGIPFYNVIGNHDMDIDARTDEGAANTFKKQFGPTYYSFNRGKIHYVTLDDVFFIGVGKRYIGYISENQLQWLEKDLAYVPKGSTVVLSLHIPTNTGLARRSKIEEPIGGTVANRAQLYKILSPYKVHIMSGHTHFNEHWEEGNIMEHNHGTVCGAWWTGPICSDGTPSGYGVYEVNGNDVSWYYKSTGHEKKHQIRIYKKGMDKSAPEKVMINVWNWDPKWKVEWFEDGESKGALKEVIGLDPWAAELYAGPALPAKHKFVEPTLADHLFAVQPKSTSKKIRIKATDRFGNIFESEADIV